MIERFAASDGAQLAYDDRGPRGALGLLFVHGWQASGDVWEPVRAALGERFRMVTPDLRGFGRSNSAPGPYTVDAQANDLSDLFAVLDLDPLVVVGHSMGAAIAQRFAIDRPEAVEGLVLMAPVPVGGAAFSPKLEAMFRATAGDAAQANAWLAKLTFREPPPGTVALLRAAAAATPAHVALESFESWAHLSFEDKARTIATPALAIAGAEDRPMTPEYVRRRVVDVIADTQLAIVPDAGHLVQLEQAERVATLIADFADAL